MKYTSTRDTQTRVSSKQAISQGISVEGGLFVPTELPYISQLEMITLRDLNYLQRAEYILGGFLSDYSENELRDCIQGAYGSGRFDDDDNAAPLKEVGHKDYFLELWHGSTCAFKDMALQLLPYLLTYAAKSCSQGRETVILVATSGDTGKAALEGFKDVAGTKIMVFYPQDGVSPAQKLQMITQEGENVAVCAIKGNFDDAQTAVKKIFTSPEVNKALLKNNMRFSSANSINWGRLAPQIVYYFSAYADLLKQHALKSTDDKVNIVVPTGNFGNILAAYYAKYMGLPVNKLICASNSNKILTDFINTGIYDKNREFLTTISPSMDILISSNLERLLYHLCNGESERVKGWMSSLEQKGVYEVEDDVKAILNKLFYAGFCSEEQTESEIYRLFKDFGYLADTHTAVASYVCGEYRRKTGDKLPCIIASTASPFKFSSSVLEALGNETEGLTEFEKIDALAQLTRVPAPEPLKGLENKAVRFEDVCTDETMIQTVFNMLGIKE